jgi:hypothetical protein
VDEEPGTAPERCGNCDTELRPIVYGFPAGELADAADRGELFLGGCCISDDSPTHRCPRCGAESGTLALRRPNT